MTDTQYLLGWLIYFIGASGCLLGLWLVIQRMSVRFRRFFMVLAAVLVYLPGITKPDMSYLAPAFLITLFDGLTYGIEGMWRTGKALLLIAGIASLIALLLPVKKQPPKKTSVKKPNVNRRQTSVKKRQPIAGQQSNRVSKPGRKEPVYR